ncbi:hypothetical protein CDD83_9606 [Cordyceps sp. RAO-2017]|nr:hypothetical protein CDD83_9606 [Cordyceps sp. RAO-2017]
MLAALRTTAGKEGFPDSLYALGLADIRDGRTSYQGNHTRDLQDSLENLGQAKREAAEETPTAERVHKYRLQVIEIEKHMSGAIKCYEDLLEKVAKTGPDQAAEDVCDRQYDDTNRKLRKAAEILQEPDFPTSWVYISGLPDVTDTRKQYQGQFTANFVGRLQEVYRAAKRGVEGEIGAELLVVYQTNIAKLQEAIESAKSCYNTYMEQLTLEGASGCDNAYDEVRSRLNEARDTAHKTYFAPQWLYKHKLPDVLDGRISLQGAYTKGLTTSLQQMTQAATNATVAAEDLQKAKTVIDEGLPAFVKQTLVETVETLAKYVALRHIAFEKGTSGSATQQAKDAVAMFAKQYEKGLDQALEKELNEFLSR